MFTRKVDATDGSVIPMLVAMTPSRIPVDGDAIRRLRERRFVWTRRELGEKTGLSEQAIQKIEVTPGHRVTPKTFKKLAEAFALSVEDAKSQITPKTTWDENVAPYSETRIEYEIPFFDLPIAASGWVHVIDNEDGGFRCTQAQIQQALFRVRVRGDSMQPRFEDGVTIEFRLLCAPDSGLPDIERLREGEPYYVQLSDGTGTFKMLKSIEPDHLVLVAINKKYKTPLVARLADIVRLGQYEHQLVK